MELQDEDGAAAAGRGKDRGRTAAPTDKRRRRMIRAVATRRTIRAKAKRKMTIQMG